MEKQRRTYEEKNILQEEISKIGEDKNLFVIDEALKEVKKKIEQITNEINEEETKKGDCR